MTRRRKPPVDPAVARLHRLIHAIGDGPHAKGFNTTHHLRCILKTLGDTRALELLTEATKKQAA